MKSFTTALCSIHNKLDRFEHPAFVEEENTEFELYSPTSIKLWKGGQKDTYTSSGENCTLFQSFNI